jgi:excisionase family DNA binding protein
MGVGVDVYLTADEVASLLKLSVQTIRRYTMLNQIPFHKINRAVRYKKTEIELWVEKGEVAKVKEQNENFEGGLFGDLESGGDL